MNELWLSEIFFKGYGCEEEYRRCARKRQLPMWATAVDSQWEGLERWDYSSW